MANESSKSINLEEQENDEQISPGHESDERGDSINNIFTSEVDLGTDESSKCVNLGEKENYYLRSPISAATPDNCRTSASLLTNIEAVLLEDSHSSVIEFTPKKRIFIRTSDVADGRPPSKAEEIKDLSCEENKNRKDNVDLAVDEIDVLQQRLEVSSVFNDDDVHNNYEIKTGNMRSASKITCTESESLVRCHSSVIQFTPKKDVSDRSHGVAGSIHSINAEENVDWGFNEHGNDNIRLIGTSVLARSDLVVSSGSTEEGSNNNVDWGFNEHGNDNLPLIRTSVLAHSDLVDGCRTTEVVVDDEQEHARETEDITQGQINSFCCVRGSVQNVFWVVLEGEQDWKINQRQIFIQHPQYHTIMFIVQDNTTPGCLLDFTKKVWSMYGYSADEAILRFKDAIVDLSEYIDLSVKSRTYCVDDETFVYKTGHSGCLWDCLGCACGFTNRKSFLKHKEKCGHEFYGIQGSPGTLDWGRSKLNYQKPWAAPLPPFQKIGLYDVRLDGPSIKAAQCRNQLELDVIRSSK